MQAQWKCQCILAEESVTLPLRLPGEDVLEWMDRVQQAIGAHHALRSPQCKSNKLEYLKIPVEDGAGLGEKAQRH